MSGIIKIKWRREGKVLDDYLAETCVEASNAYFGFLVKAKSGDTIETEVELEE